MLTAIIGVCMLAAVATLFIKRYAPEYALLVSVVSGAAILVFLLALASGVLSDAEEIFNVSDLDNSLFLLVLKALGICYLTDFGADTCRDFGQTSLASKVELAGKISVVVLTLPLIKQILSAAVELIG